LTGAWNAGVTMRLSARVAEGVINSEQVILPGYAVTHVFFDDKCDPTTSSEIVLREMKSTTKFVGLGGSGCSAVCAGTAFVASSIRLPYLSYECAGAALQDSTAYPELTRFGTVTTQKPKIIKEIGEEYADWSHVAIVSGDPGVYRIDGESLASELQGIGMSSDYQHAYENQWDEIVALVDSLRIQKRRVWFVMGAESYFRKLICASMVVGANKGIVWLSEGAWRDEWWKKSDAIIDSLQAWVKEDSEKPQLREALADFKNGWNKIAENDEEAFKVLQPIYSTSLQDELMFVEGEQYSTDGVLDAYHVYHKKWHHSYRKTMVEHSYYDVFMFDLVGNLIYSVVKGSDFATNFGTKKNLDPMFSEWQASGLGDAFRAAIAEPDVVTMTQWMPYGPSDGALASFLATGVRREDGSLTGVFATRVPPQAQSIEILEPQCTMEAISDSFEGAINFVGLGKPTASGLDRQVPCFQGRTAKAFLTLLDEHLAHGYPLGDEASVVADPYLDIRAHAVDGTCVFAYAVRELMAKGIPLYEIETHTEDAYAAFISYIKTEVEFQGVSGHVKFDGNQKPAYLAVQQVQGGSKILVGTCSHNGTTDLSLNGGPSNASWNPPHPDIIPPEADFPYFLFQILLPILCICCPALAACIRNF
jgi:hypothetical protein